MFTSSEGYTLASTVLVTFLKLETIQGKHSARESREQLFTQTPRNTPPPPAPVAARMQWEHHIQLPYPISDVAGGVARDHGSGWWKVLCYTAPPRKLS